jgi:molecular chaperone GrpE
MDGAQDTPPADWPTGDGDPSLGTRPGANPLPPTDLRDAQLADLRERLARARADYDNLHKRVQRDAHLERERARARVLEGLLPVLELARMAAHQAELHASPISEGVVLMAREFLRALEREGLSPIDAAGVPFDRQAHEAVGEEVMAGVPPGHVTRIIQPGYRLGDKVLRFAKVAVAPAGAGVPEA